MALSDQPPRDTERLRRLQNLRGWALALGAIAGVFSLIVAGASGVENPKNWSSAFSAMAAAGFLRWAAMPLAAVARTRNCRKRLRRECCGPVSFNVGRHRTCGLQSLETLGQENRRSLNA